MSIIRKEEEEEQTKDIVDGKYKVGERPFSEVMISLEATDGTFAENGGQDISIEGIEDKLEEAVEEGSSEITTGGTGGKTEMIEEKEGSSEMTPGDKGGNKGLREEAEREEGEEQDRNDS